MNSTVKFQLKQKHVKALKLIVDAEKVNADIWSHKNGARGGNRRLDDVCEYCGKPIKKHKTEIFQILTSGLIIPNRIKQDTLWELHEAGLIEDQPQGGFPIGATCATKLLGDKVNFYLEA